LDLPIVIVICGPTAVGKTSIALQLAQQLQTEIISADSRQCFKELNIGVAKPAIEELGAVRHYFIDSHSIEEEVNAGLFEKYALAAADTIFQQHRVAVMVGGTGLYIKAFTEGMDAMPVVDPAVRRRVTEGYEAGGLAFLQAMTAQHDPAFWAVAERDNPHRLMRALEVILSSGKSVTDFRSGERQARPFKVVKVGLEIPRQQLYDRINHRVDVMIANGLVEEVERLLPYKDLNALQTVGYRELFRFFDGEISLSQAIADIKTNTRHYAKRQMTWFKKDPEIRWLNPESSVVIQSILA
jgi:tRNA dimethylallyltransferase